MMLTSPCRLVGPSGSANLGGLFTSVWMFGHAGRGRQHADYVGNYMQGSGVGALARGAFPHMGCVRSPAPAGPHTTLSGGSRGQSGAVAIRRLGKNGTAPRAVCGWQAGDCRARHAWIDC
jgi:hypothetical protein